MRGLLCPILQILFQFLPIYIICETQPRSQGVSCNWLLRETTSEVYRAEKFSDNNPNKTKSILSEVDVVFFLRGNCSRANNYKEEPTMTA